jgi:hypothetical protein
MDPTRSSGRSTRLPAFLSVSIVLGVSAALAGAPVPPAPDGGSPTKAEAAAIRVTLETIAVDRRGTWSVGTDIADIFPGSSGVLEKSAALIGRQDVNAPREMVQLSARITPTRKEGAACALRIDSETKRVVAGAKAPSRPGRADRTSASVVLKDDEERLVEVYVSPITDVRLALKVRCAAPDAPGTSDLRFIDFSMSMFRADGDKDLEPLKSNHLRAALGREASDLSSYNVPLPEGEGGARRYRQEELNVALTPVLISGGQVQIRLEVRGSLATMSATAAPVTHPIERTETLVLSPGEPHAVDIEVLAGGPEEGWTRVRYRFDLVTRF